MSHAFDSKPIGLASCPKSEMLQMNLFWRFSGEVLQVLWLTWGLAAAKKGRTPSLSQHQKAIQGYYMVPFTMQLL